MIKIPNNFKLLSEFITGSNLYGCATKDSDIDIRGVFIASEEYYYGFLNSIRQFQSKNDDDKEYHEIREFLKLALNNNPNIIEYLFIPESKYLVKSSEWDEIISNRKYFISKKCKFTFSGYAWSQLHRIKRHRGWLLNPPKKKPERKDFGLLEKRSTLSKDQIGAFNILLAMYLEEIREFHSLKEQLLQMEETKNFKVMTQQMRTPMNLEAVKTMIPISDNFLEALQKEKAYMNAKAHWDAYLHWHRNRNIRRAEMESKFGWDVKHGSHIFRLMSEGEELLMTGKLTFPRPDADFLLGIKNGALSYERAIELVEGYDKKFDKLYKESILPKQPNRKKIDKLCIKLTKNKLGENNKK